MILWTYQQISRIYSYLGKAESARQYRSDAITACETALREQFRRKKRYTIARCR